VRELANSHKYARYIGVGLLQEVLGNGWCPSPAVARAAGFHRSDFYRCLRAPATRAFWEKHVLPRDLLLRAFTERLVEHLDADVRALLARMLTWNPANRPTCAEVVQDPVFGRLLGRPETGEVARYRHVLYGQGTSDGVEAFRPDVLTEWVEMEKKIVDGVAAHIG
jgi:serine/threonine protein kinase